MNNQEIIEQRIEPESDVSEFLNQFESQRGIYFLSRDEYLSLLDANLYLECAVRCCLEGFDDREVRVKLPYDENYVQHYLVKEENLFILLFSCLEFAFDSEDAGLLFPKRNKKFFCLCFDERGKTLEDIIQHQKILQRHGVLIKPNWQQIYIDKNDKYNRSVFLNAVPFKPAY